MTKPAPRGLHRPPIARWFFLQGVVLVVVSLAFLGLRGQVSWYSALLGGTIFLLSNGYFALKAFRYSGARSAKQIMNSFYKGEAGKLILCAVGFTMVFKWIQPLDIAALFLTFAIMLVTNWFTPMLVGSKTQQS
ncbi:MULTISPECIES: F0F1 ATP synthase subunit I [Marinobacter]|uniref:F0F1 ATP synthase subunit I n=1 Tax=Marinobacter suaedae TaxID=3057675 RepID=A0ABT8VZH1_9GAMM|nr:MULTISPECIES: F0F1 ATP synthase subunit I [unclassified Marinobacter]MBZ2169533.1 F0F1 ATP synthase subunit I [Marinobacter sp. F4216]MDO3721365.1 F0F1 ATP synthase subunit I [Marinobacter sp. chi1]